MEAQVEDAINYGESRLVLLRVGDQTLRVRTLGTEMKGLKIGDACHLEWDPADIHLID